MLDCIEDEHDSGRGKPIDIEYLLTNVIPSILNVSGRIKPACFASTMLITLSIEHPFLQGRGFVFASQYAKLLPLDSAGRYLDAAIQVVEATEAGIPVKISAVKAVHK